MPWRRDSKKYSTPPFHPLLFNDPSGNIFL
jgi:hypothetical protein